MQKVCSWRSITISIKMVANLLDDDRSLPSLPILLTIPTTKITSNCKVDDKINLKLKRWRSNDEIVGPENHSTHQTSWKFKGAHPLPMPLHPERRPYFLQEVPSNFPLKWLQLDHTPCYSNWTVHGTVPTYWFLLGPFTMTFLSYLLASESMLSFWGIRQPTVLEQNPPKLTLYFVRINATIWANVHRFRREIPWRCVSW